MPSPPFQFVSRVTRLSAEPGQLKPCSMEWEYDIPGDAWYIADGRVPGIVPAEFSHGLILVLSYMGCDRLLGGVSRYRALDSKAVSYGPMPLPGDILRGRVHIRRFVKSGRHLLIFYHFRCFVNQRKFLDIDACAGFFSVQEMHKERESPFRTREVHEDIPVQEFSPLLQCSKTSFREQDIDALQKGDFASCFGPGYSRQPPESLGVPRLQMLDRVVSVDRSGGRWGQGEIIGEKDITPDHWVFAAHFKNDPVLPGTMLMEGGRQLTCFYMFYLGLHTRFNRLGFQFLNENTTTVKFRGEIVPQFAVIRFRLQVRQVSVAPTTHALGLLEIIFHDKVIGICDRFGGSFCERSPRSEPHEH